MEFSAMQGPIKFPEGSMFFGIGNKCAPVCQNGYIDWIKQAKQPP